MCWISVSIAPRDPVMDDDYCYCSYHERLIDELREIDEANEYFRLSCKKTTSDQGCQTEPWEDPVARALDRALDGLSPNQQLEELRRQIEMRTVGCGWRQFETKWSFFSDERHHTIEKLRSMLLEDIIPHERALKRKHQLPAEAAPPQLNSHVIKQLGTADPDVLALEATSLFDLSKLHAKAEAARARREAAGVSDRWEAAAA